MKRFCPFHCVAFIVFLAHSSVLADPQFDDFAVPVFTMQELQQGSRRKEFASILATTGLLSVVGSENDMLAFHSLRSNAFSGLCSCMKPENSHFAVVQGVDSSLLSDETTRMTLATATVGNTPLPLDLAALKEAGCSTETVQAMEGLRDYVAFSSHVFVQALDELLVKNKRDSEAILELSDGSPLLSISSIVKSSQNLEHFHLYQKSPSASYQFDLDFHVDAGLFLTFVPGMTCDNVDHATNPDNFYLQDADGVVRRAHFPEHSIGIMLGVGAEHWLRTETPLRATRHAVALSAGQHRAWYGMSKWWCFAYLFFHLLSRIQFTNACLFPLLPAVHLVPQDAIIQDFPRHTFADMREAMVLSGKKNRTFAENEEPIDDIAIGCGSTASAPSWSSMGSTTRIHRRRLEMVDNASACNNATNFFCWMSCLSIPDVDMAAEKIQDGFSLYCLDPATLDSTSQNVSAAQKKCNAGGIIGGAHNDACVGSWQPTVPGVPSQEVHVDMESLEAAQQQFCYGGTSMYMDGFHWMNPTCIIYLFPGWILSSTGRVVAASIGTLLFGIALEAVIWKRRSFVQSFPVGWKRLTASTLFYGLQLTMGYMIMLVVMTYSGPLFMCVIFGLMAGHALFNAGPWIATKSHTVVACCGTEQPLGSSETECQKDVSNSPSIPEGITPCCQNVL